MKKRPKERTYTEWLADVAPHVDAAIEASRAKPGKAKGKRGHPAFGRPARFKHDKEKAA